MSSITADDIPAAGPVVTDDRGFAGHPLGLSTLFFTEMWERFSYYGMRALLVLYMVSPAAGGLSFDTAKATRIYAIYTSAVYFTNVFGGYLADRWLGARLAVLLGGIIIATGHFSMAFHWAPMFYVGLFFIVIGTGLLKPNISTMVGKLYGPDDPRRDSGFSIFYMSINLGAMFAPLVCGYLGQRVDWHLGFGAAGIGMTLGVIQFVVHRKRLAQVGGRPVRRSSVTGVAEPRPRLTKEDKRRLVVVFLLYFFSMLFWMAFEQSGTSFTLFADRHVRNEIFGLSFPSSWFQSVNAVFILTLAPVFSIIWMRWGKRQPSSPAKFSGALVFVSLGMFVIAAAALFSADGNVSPLWLIAVYFIHTVGELCLSPVGLSSVTKLSPVRMVGLMMGLWFLATSLGNLLAGTMAGFYLDDPGVQFRLFGGLGLASLAGAIVLFLLLPLVRKMTTNATTTEFLVSTAGPNE
ncbi:MAG: peptide MFS transporter [Pyrinomonadaceae bacterium]